ncbi:hypothetical protein EZS27_029118, partial [termite gut metagenome]
PASVVKELMENAIDAQAKNIHVLVTDAGRTCIQVIDDGKGMSETDARLSFERHATSKIHQAVDLFALRTMGFRGEALASIAAVAQVELKTRLETEEVGTRIVVAGSKVETQETISCPIGSSFSVRNLFFNIPARRKFLKPNETEDSNIRVEFERIALVHPDIAFFLHSNDSEVLNLPVSSLRQRIVSVFRKKLNEQLLAVKVDTTMVTISGFIGKPEFSRKRGARQYFFVNRRYMRHPYFHKAVVSAYEQIIPAGEQISYFLYFELEPDTIDVNIHPAKTEIKFENERFIWKILAAAVKESLGKFNVSIDFDMEGLPDIPVFNPQNSIESPKINYGEKFNPFKTSEPEPVYLHSKTTDWKNLYDGLEKPSFNEEEYALYPNEPFIEKGTQHLQLKGRFILTSVKSGLMFIDQHRAHIRILFDRYLKQIQCRQVLNNEDMVNLVDSLFACQTPNRTPDGHTVLSTIREEYIEKLFK